MRRIGCSLNLFYLFHCRSLGPLICENFPAQSAILEYNLFTCRSRLSYIHLRCHWDRDLGGRLGVALNWKFGKSHNVIPIPLVSLYAHKPIELKKLNIANFQSIYCFQIASLALATNHKIYLPTTANSSWTLPHKMSVTAQRSGARVNRMNECGCIITGVLISVWLVGRKIN